MAATMKDLSRETGLGLATISKYFNGGTVREKNRVLIEAAVKKLHYVPNEVARSLRRSRKGHQPRGPRKAEHHPIFSERIDQCLPSCPHQEKSVRAHPAGGQIVEQR